MPRKKHAARPLSWRSHQPAQHDNKKGLKNDNEKF